VDVHHFWPAVVNLFCLGFCFAGLTSLLSSVDRYRWRTVGLAIGLLVVQIVIKLFGVALKSKLALLCTFMTAFEPQWCVELAVNHADEAWLFTRPGPADTWLWGPLTAHAVLLTLGVAGYAGAIAIFTRRDLPAPL
jgi:ABC-2 type transport system permease protein